jgi:hypothetical protein
VDFTYKQMTLKSFDVVDYDLKGATMGISGAALSRISARLCRSL